MNISEKLINTRSTEEKIKDAARSVFIKKGFVATRTRDIAEASGENLALINYYFRTKENLFRIIMTETMHSFLNTMLPVFNDEHSSVESKIERIVENYIDLFSIHPDIPLFILTEIHTKDVNFLEQSGLKEKLKSSTLFVQLAERINRNGAVRYSPFQLFISILGMTIFPFAAGPLVKGMHGMSHENFLQMMEERKKLIPMWVNAILNS